MLLFLFHKKYESLIRKYRLLQIAMIKYNYKEEML